MRKALLAAAAVAAVAAFSYSSPASAGEAAWCNPVITADGTPVRTADGGYAIHKNSFRCPPAERKEAAPKPEPKKAAVLKEPAPVLFDFDRTELKPGYAKQLQDFASAAAKVPGLSVTVEGHTDSVGTERYNQGLSERRAKVVADFLRGHGIPGVAVGYGETRPVASNATPEGRALNRRAEVRVTGP